MRNSALVWLYFLSLAVTGPFYRAPAIAAGLNKCISPDGATSYSDAPCAPSAARIEVQASSARSAASAGPVIQSAAYTSPRNSRSFDVTDQLKSLCRTPGSCIVNCGNQLAGDPDFGQRKYCSIVYVCGGGKSQQLRIQEGERITLSCPADVVTLVARQSSTNPGASARSSYSASRGTAHVDESNRGGVSNPASSPVAAATEADRLVTLVREGSVEQLAAYLSTPGANINARPNARPNEDKALLDYAAELNKVAVATWLLDHGANVDGAQQQGLRVGLTALHRAAFFNSFEVAQVLIARGADVNANRSRGMTPLFYAASAGHHRIVELLLQNGADIEARAARQTTALSTAAQQGHLDIVKLLEAHGATLNDDPALPEAAFNQHADIVRYLLGRNQSQSAKDSALRFAVIAADSRTDTASLDLISILIAGGANVNNTVNGAPNTPIMMAKRAELRELLLGHGALDFATVRAGQASKEEQRDRSSGSSQADTGNHPAVISPASSPVGVASPEIVELARIVQTLLGGNSPGIRGESFDMFAALEMRVIAANDPGWNRSNPRWVALFNTVKQDLKRDTEPALEASMADGRREIAATLGSRLATADVSQLLAFYRSGEGERYIAFQNRLGEIQAQGITQLTGALIGAASASPSDAPSQERLDARRRVLANSWTSLMLHDALSNAADPRASTEQPDVAAFLGATSDVVAKTHGQEIDALEREYATDLPRFEVFQQSPAARSLLSAMKVVFQQAAGRPQSATQFKAALDRSVALHTASWKAGYEAGRSSTATPQGSGTQDSLPGTASAASSPTNVQIEQHARVTSVTIPGQLAPTQTLGCIAIEKVKSTATPPDLYNASRACVDQGDYDDAVPLFLLGGAYGRFDAARVADKSAGQGVTILIMGFGNGLREDQKQAFTTATSKFQASESRVRLCGRFKHLGPPNYFPQYMILHGIKAFTTADPTADALVHDFDAAATWQRILAEGLNCAADRH